MRKIKNIFLLYLLIPVLDQVMGTRIFYYYRLITKMNKWSVVKIKDWQERKLRKIIKHFYKNSSYFRQEMENRGLIPDSIIHLEDIKKLPILTKQIIQDNWNTIVPKNIESIRYKRASTGGSTGNPLRFLISYDSWSYTTAAKIYSWQKTSYLYGDKYIALGSSSLFPVNKKSIKHKLYFILKSAVPLNGVNMSDEKIKEYVGIIKSKKIHYLYGYASSIYMIARYCNKNKVTLKIRGCFPTSEILTDTYRDEILSAFNCEIVDSYGARDGGITAFEIKEGHYHIGYNSYVESKQAQTNDGAGIVLVSDLLNKAFPFIRYEIGDEAVFNLHKNRSYNGQVFAKILGRISMVIHLDNGRTLTGPGFTILFKDLNVIAYRTSLLHGKKILVEIQPGDNYSRREEDLILRTYRKHVGDDCEIDLKYVDKFSVTPNGKRLFFLNQ